MHTALNLKYFFDIWWVLVNSLLYYAEINFLRRYTGDRRYSHIALYIITNDILTVMAIYTQRFTLFTLFNILWQFIFMSRFLRVSPKKALTPIVIIFTLSTFMEGFVAVIMRFLSLTLESRTLGFAFQLTIPVVFAVFVFLALRLIAERYREINKDVIFSYVYILLIPCVLMIWGIRTGLGLDISGGPFSQGALITGEVSSFLYASLGMTGVLVIFFIIIEVFYKITLLSRQNMEKALLASQVKEQQNYLGEAQKRNENYRSFQHDINNHLLVLSGLLHGKKYKQAEHFLNDLNIMAQGLSADISTGNSVLDVLLWEKIRYAKQQGISVSCDVRIPPKCPIDNIDLCILFSNGLDNAVAACGTAPSNRKTIELTAMPKHSFLLIEMVNGVNDSHKPISMGTGLKNMELTIEKYDGVMNLKEKDNKVYLSILLCCET